jgi:hypothetical protein
VLLLGSNLYLSEAREKAALFDHKSGIFDVKTALLAKKGPKSRGWCYWKVNGLNL